MSGRIQPRRGGGLPAPAARCHPERVTGVAGRAGRIRHTRGHDGPGCAGHGLAAKKKSVHTVKHAAKRDTERVSGLPAAFVEAAQTGDFTRFKFVDETSTNLTYCRRCARAKVGQRAQHATPLHGGPNLTLIAAPTPDGLGALLSVSGAVNDDVFAAYLDQVLGPTLRLGYVVVLDNLPAHKVGGLAGLVEAHGARLLYLPPDFNSIELAFSTLKRGCAWPRPAPARPWKPSFRPPPTE